MVLSSEAVRQINRGPQSLRDAVAMVFKAWRRDKAMMNYDCGMKHPKNMPKGKPPKKKGH